MKNLSKALLSEANKKTPTFEEAVEQRMLQ
jgi:hypothetical protein